MNECLIVKKESDSSRINYLRRERNLLRPKIEAII